MKEKCDLTFIARKKLKQYLTSKENIDTGLPGMVLDKLNAWNSKWNLYKFENQNKNVLGICYLPWNFANLYGIFSFLGHYFFVEGNDGVRGEIAVLTTPNVTTGVGQSLGFYYHIITENDFTFIQSEGLSVIAQLPDGRSQLLWWQNQTSSYEWLYGCVNLPDNTHLNIQFVTKRIGLDNQNNVFDADVAVDDIALLLLPCSGGKISIIFLLIYLFHFLSQFFYF